MADEQRARPLEVLAARGFLTQPQPEEFCKLSAVFNGAISSRLIVGVKVILKDQAGLNIVPTAQIVFEIDQPPSALEIDIPASMARDLIPRLQEMCDAADSLNQSRDQANGR